MSTQAEAEKIVDDVIRAGRAAVRIVEAADILFRSSLCELSGCCLAW